MDNSRILEAVLNDHPVMQRKLTSFVEDYGLSGKPALIWQCRPKTAVGIDITTQAINNVVKAGASTQRNNGWWYGFKSDQRPKPIFDGLAAYDNESSQGWMSEIHTDGHIIAGIWTFIETEVDGSRVKCVADFYAEAFLDFGALAAKLLEASAIPGECSITCTLLNATDLAYCKEMHPNQVNRINRKHLQWEVRDCLGPVQIADISNLMATEFIRAYGYFRRQQ